MILKDIKAGDKVETEFIISKKRIKLFSELVDDYAPIHFDEEFAKVKGFEGSVAHGLLTSSFISGVLGNKLPGPNSVINEINVKYHLPVYPEQKITVVIQVQRVIESVNAVYLDIKIKEEKTSSIVISGRAICSFPTQKI